MKFRTRRFLFIAIVIAICLPIPVLIKFLVIVPVFEGLLLDFNEFCYQKYEKKTDRSPANQSNTKNIYKGVYHK